jgi:hypothetical protein
MSQTYDWREVAHTVDGYELAGSIDACVARAREVEGRLAAGRPVADVPTEDLRITLFFLARAERHGGHPWKVTSHPDAIVAELRRRNGEPWFEAEVAQLHRKPLTQPGESFP